MHWYKLAKLNTDIKITPLEESIFNLIRDVIREYNLGTVPRVAGGWVRDKVLGKDSDDIDISLDNMTGMRFARFLSLYARRNRIEGVSKPKKIEARPEQAKHLETVTMSIFGQKVEFMNLRTEGYGNVPELMEKAQDVVEGKDTKLNFLQYVENEKASRIPDMEFGTLQEDAARRDLTINSLFYNLDTNQVEDPNGVGLQDLETGVLRSPTDPMTIMAEDPLRALRVIRFSSKMGFRDIDPKLMEALNDPRIHLIFDAKITSERKAEELYKILTSPSPEYGMRLLHDTNLDESVFPLPEDFSTWEMDQQSRYHDLNVLDHTLKALEELNKIGIEKGYSERERFVTNMAAFLHDIGKLDPEVQGLKKVKIDGKEKEYKIYIDHHLSSAGIAEQFMRNLKMSNDDIDDIKKLVEYHMESHEHGGKRSGAQLVNLILKMDTLWDKMIDMGYADALAKGMPSAEQIAKKDEYRARVEALDPEKLLGMKVERKPQLQTHLNGHDLQQLLYLPKGPEVGKALEALNQWQIKNYALNNELASKEDEMEFVTRVLYPKMAVPLLNGNDIMNISRELYPDNPLGTGKEIGRIKSELVEKQRTREITTPQQAKDFVATLIQQTQSGGVA